MNKPEPARSRFFRRGDLYIAGAVLLLALGMLMGGKLLQRPGKTAVVTAPEGEFTLSLDIPATRVVEGKNGITLTIEVSDGRVRVRDSGCPDQICVNSGWLSSAGQTAACVPAAVAVRVTGEQAEVDIVAGRIQPALTAPLALLPKNGPGTVPEGRMNFEASAFA